MKHQIFTADILPPESGGAVKLSMWDGTSVQIENHEGIADVRNECVKVWAGGRLLAVNGEKLMLAELNGYVLKIKGRIFSIEYLT